MANQRGQNRSRGGPGSSHKERDQTRGPTSGMARNPHSAGRRVGAGSPAGAGNGTNTTRISADEVLFAEPCGSIFFVPRMERPEDREQSCSDPLNGVGGGSSTSSAGPYITPDWLSPPLDALAR
jgi:hypothetical protein